ncbi:MAG: ROK family glucokinase [Solobacterium sp.]|nr:ROK family glucokinase [Solobacterium sp.]
MSNYCIGIDIGGTTVKCGIFKVSGELIDKWEVPTRKENAGKNILPDVAEVLKKKIVSHGLTNNDIRGIGLGVPGPVEPNGYVSVCVNLGWHKIYPAREMSALMGGTIPCKVGNDANVAALGEMWMGGGKGRNSIIAITLGTGVGGGIIIDGKIVAGAHGLGGEIGHMHMREEEKEFCNCGGRGCLEQVASATGIAREAKRNLAKSDLPSKMREFGDAITAKDVCDCAKAGDKLAIDTMETCCRYLGWNLALLAYVVDPEAFVIGGGVSKAGAYLINLIQLYFNEFTQLSANKPEIVLATLGNDAGIYGCARMVLD